MNEQNLAHFEAHLERLIEGAFAQMFSKTVRAQDIALQLARAMENEALPVHNGDPRLHAPDIYTIRLHPEVRVKLLQRQPALDQILGQHMVELAAETGYHLSSMPEIVIVGDNDLAPGDLIVEAGHTHQPNHATAVMQRVEAPPARHDRPLNAQLILNGQQTFFIEDPIINIGRSKDNHVVLDDPFASRHHAQMRLRFGRYTLFDIQSQSGTFVNNVRVREHQMQTGDVIRIGKIQLVYLEDDFLGDSQTHAISPDD